MWSQSAMDLSENFNVILFHMAVHDTHSGLILILLLLYNEFMKLPFVLVDSIIDIVD